VTVSYYEWLQNQANEQWDYEQVMDRLRARMYKAVDAVFDRWQSFVVGEEEMLSEAELPEGGREVPDFRTVALIIAIERVTRATLMRGIWPEPRLLQEQQQVRQGGGAVGCARRGNDGGAATAQGAAGACCVAAAALLLFWFLPNAVSRPSAPCWR
jgi:hypothetical protein